MNIGEGETDWRVRGAVAADDAEIGRILWEAFGRKMRAFFGEDGDASARLLADLFATGALRRESARIAAMRNAVTTDAPRGVCVVRLPGVPYRSLSRMAGVALRHAGWRQAPRAFAGLLMLDEPTRPGVAVIALLAVAPEARGRGAGGALLHAVEAEARARGLHRLALHVIENNPARRLYERHGFRTVRTHPVPRPLAERLGYARFDTMEKPLR